MTVATVAGAIAARVNSAGAGSGSGCDVPTQCDIAVTAIAPDSGHLKR